MSMCDLSYGLEVWDIILWVSNALKIYGLGVLVNCGSKILRLVSVDELGVDAQSREEDFQLVVGSTVKVGRGYNIVSSMCQCRNCHELSSLA